MERPAYCKLRGERYRNPSNEWLAKFIQEQLFTLDYGETAAWYATARKLSPKAEKLLGDYFARVEQAIPFTENNPLDRRS